MTVVESSKSIISGTWLSSKSAAWLVNSNYRELPEIGNEDGIKSMGPVTTRLAVSVP